MPYLSLLCDIGTLLMAVQDWSSLIQFDKELLLQLNGSHSLFLDVLVRTLTRPTTYLAFYASLVLLVLKNNRNVSQIFLIFAAVALCTLLAGFLNDWFVKPGVARWRPGRDPEIGFLVDTVNGYRSGSFGFFSSHASNTMSVALFLALLVRSRYLTATLFLWSLVKCWTRTYLGVHFPGDVTVGILWGLFVGGAVWAGYRLLMRRMNLTTHYISTHYTSQGYKKSDCDLPVLVLALTYVYAVFRACLSLT